MNNSYLAVLSLSRLAAALTVVACQIRSILFLDYPQVGDRTMAVKLFYFLTSLGHEAFVVYLVLSGLLLGGCSYRRWHTDPGKARPDLRNRAIRFYSLLIPALVLGVSLDITGLGWFARCGIYPDVTHFAATLDLSALAGNVLMLQRFLVPGLGTNVPLSLVAVECWAYLAFASMFMVGPNGHAKGLRQAMLIVVIGSALAPSFFGYLLVWMIGVFTSRAAQVLVVRIPRRIGAGAFLLMLTLSRGVGVFQHELEEFIVLPVRLALDLGLALAFACLLIAVRRGDNLVGRLVRIRAFHWRLSRHVGDLGGTLLIMHYPLAIFAVTTAHALLRTPVNAEPGGVTLLVFVATLGLVLGCAQVLAKIGAVLAYGFRPRKQFGK